MYKCKSGETCRFHWLLAANGDWTDGTAPVNIYYQLNDAKQRDQMLYSGEFTVVDPYISPQHYKAPDSLDHPKAQASGLSDGMTPIALLAAFLIARKRPIRRAAFIGPCYLKTLYTSFSKTSP